MRRAVVLATLLLVPCGGVVALGATGAVESWLFYFPSRRAFRDPPGVEGVAFETADGLRLTGWFWAAGTPGSVLADAEVPPGWTPPAPSESGARPTILVAHGNAGCLPDHDEFCSFLSAYGYNVLLFDYRGYGRSDLPRRGLRREDLVLDARAALAYLLTREDVDPERLGLLGYSLGGNIGLGMAADETRIKAVVTLATFSRWKEVASDHAGVLGRWLIPSGLDGADSAAWLGDRPLLIVHGDNDDIVPFRHAALLEGAASRAGVPVSRLDVPGADHLNMTEDGSVQHAIAAFFAGAFDARATDGRAAPSHEQDPDAP